MKEKRIPTLLAILFLLVALASTLFLLKNGSVFFLKAAADITPGKIKITNLTDSSFTVSWITAKETTGFLTFTETNSSDQQQVAFDDRDENGKTNSYITHYITLKNLKPKTKYFFRINSGQRYFDNAGKPYEIITANQPAGNLPPNDVASGIIVNADGTPAKGVLVYLNMANMTPQSTITSSSGNWLIPLNAAFSINLNSFATYDKEAQVEEILAEAGSLGTATALVTTKNDNPVPKITLGQTFDFRKAGQAEETAGSIAGNNQAAPSPTPTQPVSGFTPPSPSPSSTISPANAELKIISPTENENVATEKPNIFGTGPANKNLQIVVESPETYTDTIKTDSSGNWNYTPPANLSPGEHTVKITYAGKTISRTFTVLAAGESELPAFTATPSGTATTLPTSKISPTPTVSVAKTPTPTVTPTPTPLARTSMPSTQSGTPQSGNLTYSFLVSIMGLVLIISGFFVQKILAHEY